MAVLPVLRHFHKNGKHDFRSFTALVIPFSSSYNNETQKLQNHGRRTGNIGQRSCAEHLLHGIHLIRIEHPADSSTRTARLDALNSTGSVTIWNNYRCRKHQYPQINNRIAVSPFIRRPIRISGHAAIDPKFAAGTRAPLILSGAYPVACCTACPHSWAATPDGCHDSEIALHSI